MNSSIQNNLKKYYTIGEIAQLFDVSTSLIRFWEKQFHSLQPKKYKQGARRYTQEDIAQLKIIYQLVKELCYTLHGAKELLKLRSGNSKINAELILAL